MLQLRGSDIMIVSDIRKDFPILGKKIHGNDLVYFDNGATTQKTQSVINAESNYYQMENSNVHRGVHFLSRLATDKFEETRIAVQNFIGAQEALEVIFTRGATESINIIANGYRSLLKKGDEIILSELEHHSNIVPWQMCCKYSGANLKIIPLLEDGSLDISGFESLISEKTKLVSISHISNTLGTINPVKYIIKKAHEVGAKVMVDGAQAASHLSLIHI